MITAEIACHIYKQMILPLIDMGTLWLKVGQFQEYIV